MVGLLASEKNDDTGEEAADEICDEVPAGVVVSSHLGVFQIEDR